MKERGWNNHKYHQNGILALVHDKRRYNQKEWTDVKKHLESRLAELLAYLEIHAKNKKERRIEWKKQRKIEAEKRERQGELQRKKDDEIRTINVL